MSRTCSASTLLVQFPCSFDLRGSEKPTLTNDVLYSRIYHGEVCHLSLIIGNLNSSPVNYFLGQVRTRNICFICSIVLLSLVVLLLLLFLITVYLKLFIVIYFLSFIILLLNSPISEFHWSLKVKLSQGSL